MDENDDREETLPTHRTRERALQIVRGVLASDIHVLQAVVSLCPLVHSDPTIATTEDASLLIGLRSEMDHLPIGKVRGEWHPDFLSEKDLEIVRLEKLLREDVRSVCERIFMRIAPLQ